MIKVLFCDGLLLGGHMADTERQPLKVFLCHASGDKPLVRDLYKRLVAEGVDAWLDKEKLLPGQDWRLEIPKAVKEADVVVVCLSNKSVTKEGYVQKEIKFALDIAEEKPAGAIFLIPARLEDCIVPERLSRWQWVDLYEENGFIQLLRSLKLRAVAVGAIIEPASYEDSDKETEQRLDQLYTEGLAAFYTEDWDRACHRFQTILSERPSHKNAAEKLAEAERRRSLAKLYLQAAEAYQTENWQVTIKILEELSQKSAGYKDVAQLLGNARKQKQLRELYAEARTLHTAQKWQAVVKVFEQISVIEPNYPDPDGLLTSAHEEVAEIKRIEELNSLYSQAVREMDAGQWFEARRLLEQVHKAQTGFLETERLLMKVEDEITRVEEHNQRNNQVNVLYEQAHGLLRSKKWRKALDKMEDIQKLEDQFLDKDGVSEKAKTELAREEREAQRQNELAAMYAEAVRLSKEGKHQEAMDKFHEVRVVDSKYPDRQRIQSVAKKQLTSATPRRTGFSISHTKRMWLGIGGILVVGIILGITWFIENLTVSDNFENKTYDGAYNASLWNPVSSDSRNFMRQENGSMGFISHGWESNIALLPKKYTNAHLLFPSFFETSFMLPPAQNGGTDMHIDIAGKSGSMFCQIWGEGMGQFLNCQALGFGQPAQVFKGIPITPGSWHTARIEINPRVPIYSFYLDGKKVGELIPLQGKEYRSVRYNFYLLSGCNGFGCTDLRTTRVAEGFFDNVQIGIIP
jgi:outer membrane protein assembly factor BamD (BamD/ComL family)